MKNIRFVLAILFGAFLSVSLITCGGGGGGGTGGGGTNDTTPPTVVSQTYESGPPPRTIITFSEPMVGDWVISPCGCLGTSKTYWRDAKNLVREYIDCVFPINQILKLNSPPYTSGFRDVQNNLLLYTRIPINIPRSSPPILTPPANLLATLNLGSTPCNIELTWVDNSTDEIGFVIEMKIASNGTYHWFGNVNANENSYYVSPLTPLTTYYFRVFAYNSSGSSDYSNEISVTTTSSGNYVPNAPSNLSATVVSSSQIDLTWTDNSTNETGFIIMMRTGWNGTYDQVVSLGLNATNFSVTGLKGSTTYYFSVYAYNSSGNSDYSNEVVARTE